ncbi:carbohydrate kinase family protein [Paenibacillus qinlingensis]|uniref:Sugar/nucleoside kinase (Ribokinase family) n=1 Tax=Paenibacillus qinlingensis TaxID=1837343 RepID=A0ABU1NNQ5_9BACL|nr:carbohydrate kinase family protein [Paenibacillus qinlingensis]MDR6549090.1 sugar/nucleoside kinase (ribokinase family) [Paenibacillus qinlingensis]
MSGKAEVVVAGHICLDIIPTMDEKQTSIAELLSPGKLVNIGPAVISTGGAVSNTGIALHRLGSKVKLMGKIGADPFGEAILTLLRQQEASLVEGMIISREGNSSYSIVISPPNMDRMFLHSTGTNDTYAASDLKQEHLQGAKLFHFGYPPLMKRMFENEGGELLSLLKKVKESELTVSLDLAKPDPESDAGRANWRAILTKSLPFVDVFLPSFEEIVYMLDRERYDLMEKASPDGDLLSYVDVELLAQLSAELIQMGVAIVVIKLGEHGVYVRTTSDEKRLAQMGFCSPKQDLLDDWLNCEMISSCYEVDVVGTTGAGDCTIAGFLFGLTRGLTLKESLQSAVGVGACNVEQADATSGIPEMAVVQDRMYRGWKKRATKLKLVNWHLHEDQIWIGPHHKSPKEGVEANEAK